jgi:hypothetical protein
LVQIDGSPHDWFEGSAEAGNAYLSEFMQDLINALQTNREVNVHRSPTVKDDLARILTWQDARTISKNLMVQFENTVCQIQTECPTYTMRNVIVIVCVDAKQKVTLIYNSKSLPYTIFHTCIGVRRKCKQIKQSEVVITKDFSKTIKTNPAPIPHKPAPDDPWRVFPISALENG